MASREVSLLHPAMKHLVDQWLGACPVHVLIYCTVREPWEQADLYARGRTEEQIANGVARLDALKLSQYAMMLQRQHPKPGPKVTNALPGFTFHHGHWVDGQYGGLALDFVPMIGGKPQWKAADLYEQAGVCAEGFGLTWSGRWTTFKETCHIQYDRAGELKILPLVQGAYR